MIKVSAISFLNTAPLTWGLQRGEAARHLELTFDLPSACAARLREGRSDVALIPVAEYLTIPGLVLLPDVCIAARGPVNSIFLVSDKPLDQVRTVAADTSSRTSVLLAKLLFRAAWGGDREFVPMPPDAGAMLAECDAALIIGDPALRLDRTRYSLVLDLAEHWTRLTSLPMVFALWAIRLDALSRVPQGLLERAFRDSRDEGLRHLDEIAAEWAPRLSLAPERVREYLSRDIHYSLDANCLAGLETFFRMLVQHGLLAHAPELRFLGALRLLAGLTR